MKHFVISRFNINHLHYVNHNLGKALSRDWFIERCNLFFCYTYPTIANQSIKDFHWLVLFDERTNKDLLEDFQKRDELSLITPVFVGDSNYLEILKDKILQLSGCVNEIITTSLDTDDGVSIDFIKEIQIIYKNSRNKPPYGINFNRGFIVDCKTNIFYRKSFFSNPFFSLVENIEYLKTVCFYPHHLLSFHFDTINHADKEYWLQNIHNSNFGNVIKGFPLAPTNNSYLPFSYIYSSPNWSDYYISILGYGVRKYRNGIIKIFRLFK